MTSDPSWLDDPALSSKIYNLIRISLPFHIPANQDHIASATNSVLAAIRAAAPAPSPPPPNRGGTEDVAQRETAPSPRPDALATIAEHVRDLAWKATAFGHDASEYEWTTSYLLPAGPLHRLVGAMQSVGETCSLRSGSAPEDAQRIGDPSPD
jgi:hypothetical protein